MGTIQYFFEGTMKVYCSVCNKPHEIVFNGDEQTTINLAIEEALATAGWDMNKLICPDCFDPLDEPIDTDEELGDNYFDDIDAILDEEMEDEE